MTTTEQKQKQEMVLPSFFYAIASSESRQLISLDELRKHPTPMTIQLHPQCLLGIQGILRNWTFLIFKQV